MRRLLYTTLMLVLCLTANAREIRKGVSINDVITEIVDDKLNIDFKIHASGLELNSDGQLKLEFAIENEDRRLILPVVIYSGSQRYRYERRREILSNTYHIQPYHTYKGVNKHHTYELEYRLSIPYYTWMENASVTYCEYMYGCYGNRQITNGTLADINPIQTTTETIIPIIEYTEPEVETWTPNPALFPNLASFLIPEVEEVKSRASMLELNIGFPVNVTELHPEFGNNYHELTRADSLIHVLNNNSLININSFNIKGYASPEGRYDVNERLARERSYSFHRYLAGNYSDNTYIRNANISWVAEDWEGVGKLVEQYDIPAKQDVLAIVNDDAIAPDTKDIMLQNLIWWSDNYKVILKEMYPKLRRIEFRVDYTVNNLTDSDARELLYTSPELLSLEEIYRVARYYDPGSVQYRKVYEIAARQFPEDIIANNNAAAALLQEGNAEEALPYLNKIAGVPESFINYGTYYYISGNLEKAIEYLNKAKDAGMVKAGHNLNLIDPAKQ